jgi:hypothetical protein
VTDAPATYLLVLGDKRGTAWVLRESRTALARERVRDVKRVAVGDRLLLYASNTAFGSGSGLFGWVTVTREVQYLEQAFRLNFKEFHADLPFRFEQLVPIGDFTELASLVPKLDLVAGNREKWGVYLRRPVIALTEHDAALMTDALLPKCKPADEVLSAYLEMTEYAPGTTKRAR